jgi:hypothetical protein
MQIFTLYHVCSSTFFFRRSALLGNVMVETQCLTVNFVLYVAYLYFIADSC